METREMAKKGLYAGTGAGLILFALMGMLPSLFVSGVIGLKIANGLAGGAGGALLARLIVGASMILGILVSGMVFVICTSLFGWIVGSVMDAGKPGRAVGTGPLPNGIR